MIKAILIQASAVALALTMTPTASASQTSRATYGGQVQVAIDYSSAVKSANDPKAACRVTVCGRAEVRGQAGVVAEAGEGAKQASPAEPKSPRLRERCVATYCGRI